MQKYGFDDARPVLERASARETAARVALGAVARRSCARPLGVDGPQPRRRSWARPRARRRRPGPRRRRPRSTPTRCAALTRRRRAAMVAEIDAAQKDGDTLGGVVEVVAYGLPPGLGSHVHWDRRLDARLAGALMGIQAIKGVEVGDGFETARAPRQRGARRDRARPTSGVRRRTGRSGGTEGGMSTGEVLRVRAAMKPISTVPRALDTVDVATGEPAKAINQRSDVCAVPAAGVVAEAMVALVLADARAGEVRRGLGRGDAPQHRRLPRPRWSSR